MLVVLDEVDREVLKHDDVHGLVTVGEHVD